MVGQCGVTSQPEVSSRWQQHCIKVCIKPGGDAIVNLSDGVIQATSSIMLKTPDWEQMCQVQAEGLTTLPTRCGLPTLEPT